jgi:hypothetical protein
MCDFSLHSLRNRLATEGEQLVVHRFETYSIGLASPSDLTTAVCIPPGARLFVQDIPDTLRTRLTLSSAEEVVFDQRTIDARVHRDVIRFANGGELLLQLLKEGQRVQVLSLGSKSFASSSRSAESLFAGAI